MSCTQAWIDEEVYLPALKFRHAAELATLRTALEKAQRDNAHLKAEFTKMPARVNDLKRTAGALRSQLKNEQEARERQVEIARGGIARENAQLRAEVHDLERQSVVAERTVNSMAEKFARLAKDAAEGRQDASNEAFRRKLERDAIANKFCKVYAEVLGVNEAHFCDPDDVIVACRDLRIGYESLKNDPPHKCTITVPYGKALRAADHLRRALEVARGKMKWLQDQRDYFWGENKRLRQRERIWNVLFVMYVAAWVAMYIYTRHFY